MTPCVFCKIIDKEIPSVVLYEDELVVAMMDIGPVIKGHVLILSKQHHESITDTPDETLAQLALVAKRMAQAQIDALGADGVNVMQNNGAAAGQEVPHIHLHVIPRFKDDGHTWNWTAGQYESPAEMKSVAQQIMSSL